jgi:hypothetical protein
MPTPVVLPAQAAPPVGSRDLKLHVQVSSENGDDRLAGAYRVSSVLSNLTGWPVFLWRTARRAVKRNVLDRQAGEPAILGAY